MKHTFIYVANIVNAFEYKQARDLIAEAKFVDIEIILQQLMIMRLLDRQVWKLA